MSGCFVCLNNGSGPKPVSRVCANIEHLVGVRSSKLRLGVKPLESIGTCWLSWHVKAGRLRG